MHVITHVGKLQVGSRAVDGIKRDLGVLGPAQDRIVGARTWRLLTAMTRIRRRLQRALAKPDTGRGESNAR